MGLSDLLRSLVEHGRVRIAARDMAPDAEELAATDEVLAEWDAANRLEFPGEAPRYSPEVARWAAQQFHCACGFAVYRDMGADMIESALRPQCPAADAASQHYSADLVFRFLPDLYRFTTGASSSDPLCDRLRKWASQWPLSSVGMDKITPDSVEPICQHAGLLRLYVDRVLAKGDSQRLTEPRVRAAAQAALGYFPELAPSMASVLDDSTVSSEKDEA